MVLQHTTKLEGNSFIPNALNLKFVNCYFLLKLVAAIGDGKSKTAVETK